MYQVIDEFGAVQGTYAVVDTAYLSSIMNSRRREAGRFGVYEHGHKLLAIAERGALFGVKACGECKGTGLREGAGEMRCLFCFKGKIPARR